MSILQGLKLFATHHELNEMSESLTRFRIITSQSRKKDTVLLLENWKEEVPIVLNSCSKMAGMPQIVILKAQKLLKKLEKDHSSDVLNGIKSDKDEMQMSFSI
jgi:DNA mismatch repair protein MutS